MILMVFPSLRLSYDQHQVFTGTELGSLAGDAVTDHSQEECGHLRCKPADQGPATSGGDTGSADDGNQPSQTDSSSPSTGVSEITGTNGSDGSDGADTDHDIPHHCMHGHDHVRCVNHTFDIGSSISQVTDIFGPSVPEVPIGFDPDFDVDDTFTVPVDTTAADISAISLPLESIINTILSPRSLH